MSVLDVVYASMHDECYRMAIHYRDRIAKAGVMVARSRQWLRGASLALIVCFSHQASASEAIREFVDPPRAPGLVLPTITGGEFDIAHSIENGQASLVVFWASWCAPCRRELPALKRISGFEELSGVDVVLVNFGESDARIQAFLETVDTGQLPVAVDAEKSTGFDWRVGALPLAYLVSPSGHVLAGFMGEIDWMNQDVIERLRVLSGEVPVVQ